ncbi:MAG: cation diffusion facilitator family transporter, partial [Caldimicrobium sp.]
LVMELRNDSQAFKLTLLSFIVSFFICGLKFLAYFLTKSVSIYSDALESIINIFSALFAMLGIKIALKPPDEDHPYGHTKIEYLIAIIEGLFVVFASFSILWKSVKSLQNPEPISYLNLGMILVIFSILLNSSIAWIIYKIGKREASPILVSHSIHIFTDILTSLGVLVTIFMVKLFNLWYLDPIFAIFLGLNILYMGYKIFKEAINSLLDVSLPPDKRKEIKEIIDKTISESTISHIGIHNFKSRKAGRKDFIEFHLTVPKDTTVEEAHNLCDEIEKKIKDNYPEVSVTIHIEPHKEEKS